MTKDEAIKWLKAESSYIEENVGHGKEILEAYDVAIKALEQQPCDDCISREAVMKCFEKWQPYMATRLWDYELALKDLPSVTPQPTTGRWMATENEEGEIVGYFCSRCDLPMETDEKTKYCPNCGARMEVENAE